MIKALDGVRKRTLAVLLSVAIVPVCLANWDVTLGEPGQNVTVWYGWNVSTTLTLNIQSEHGPACAYFWWNRMGFNSEVGELCGLSELEVSLPWIFGKLRAGKLQSKTAIGITEKGTTVGTFQLCGEIVKC